MKKLIIFFTISLFPFFIFATDDVAFSTDRPTVTASSSLVGRNSFQWEQGFRYDNNGNHGQFTFSNTLLRYGLFDHMELRLSGDAYLYQESGDFHTAFTGISIGTKISCYEGKGAIPAISVLANLAIPHTGTTGVSAEHLAPSLYLLFDNPIGERFNLGYNIGAAWNGTHPTPSSLVTLCLGYKITDNLGSFIESYNTFAPDGNAYGIDLGFTYMLAKKLQLDIAGNFDVCNPANSWGACIGIAWNFNLKK